MEPQIEQLKTLETLIGEMKDSIKFIESRSGFLKEDSPREEERDTFNYLKEVTQFVDEEANKEEKDRYFTQWVNYAEIFASSLNNLKFKIEDAEQENFRGNFNENEPLKEEKEILEGLKHIVEGSKSA